MHRLRMSTSAMRTAQIVLVVAVLAVVGASVRSVLATNVVPTPEFIAAAMKNQEKAGLSLQVRYSDSTRINGVIADKHVTGEVVRNGCYIRNPETMFLKEEVTRNYDPGVDTTDLLVASSTVTTSYDRLTHEYRRRVAWNDGSPPQGVDTYDPTPNDMDDLTRVESVASYSTGASLLRLVKSGTVLQKRETVDGHSCWGVAYDTIPDVQRHVIWVDPDIGFCPRRIDLILNKQLRRSKTMRDYRELGYGVWFPKEVLFETFDKTGRLEDRHSIKVKEAAIVPLDRQAVLQVDIPSAERAKCDQPRDGQDH